MKNFKCGKSENSDLLNEFFECGTCGNHVCQSEAKAFGMICPYCFGKLYHIN